MRKWMLAAAVLSLLVGFLSFRFSLAYYERMVEEVELPSFSFPVPPYAVVSPEMLTAKRFPRALLSLPVVKDKEELVGKIAVQEIPPGAPVFRHQVQDPLSFRFTSDPSLEVISFPVEPARAVGGQVRRGQKVNIYAVSREGVEVLGEEILVVDVRTSSGGKVGEDRPVGIVTVAASPSEVQKILRALGRERVEIWISLSPLK